MSNDNNKKVNNEEEPLKGSSEAFDEMIDGVYNLARSYTERKPGREEELRLKDEQRREREMNAIREDIERRYSLQLEEAKINADNLAKEASEHSGGKAKLDEMLDLDAFRNEEDEEVKKPKKQKEKKKKTVRYIDLDEKNAFYAGLYGLGDTVIKLLGKLIGSLFGIITYPLSKIRSAVRSSTSNLKKGIDNRAKGFARELVYFRREVRSAMKSIVRGLRHPGSLMPIIGHYIGKALVRHRDLLRTFVNILAPVAAVIVMITVFNYWKNVTFALKVIYNGAEIGYISDETVFTQAKDLVSDRLTANSTGSSSQGESLDAGYELALVSLDELSDAKTIADSMIENSIDNLTHACGIYIDDKFICAVKNEADARTVFYSILKPYEADAKEQNCVVGFAENIDYVQGLYRDDAAVMCDASQLEKTVLGLEGAAVSYTVKPEDTLYSIADAFGAATEDIEKLNPDINFDELSAGLIISVPSYNRMISIKKTVTSSSVRPVPYQTETTRDPTKYSGYRFVRRKGENGTENRILTLTYINGEEVDKSIRYETIVEPVNEQIIIGSMTTFGGIYIGEASDMGFLWPAPHCHYVSSPYGWRSSGWHKGIDLCTTDGTAIGTPVIASRSGRVEVVQRSLSGYGYMVLINHGDGYKTRYAHLLSGSILVNVGDEVEAGEQIGKVGSTGNSSGPHLHFEVIYNGETQDPKIFIS